MLNTPKTFHFLLILPIFIYLGGCSKLDMETRARKKAVSVLTGKPQGTQLVAFGNKNQTDGLPVNAIMAPQ